MGFTNFTKLIQKTFPTNQYDLMKRKLQLLWVKETLNIPTTGF
jgi:hypothetical protein